jgi:hypothetical protein
MVGVDRGKDIGAYEAELEVKIECGKPVSRSLKLNKTRQYLPLTDGIVIYCCVDGTGFDDEGILTVISGVLRSDMEITKEVWPFIS